jgi:hypothetical protein
MARAATSIRGMSFAYFSYGVIPRMEWQAGLDAFPTVHRAKEKGPSEWSERSALCVLDLARRVRTRLREDVS